MELVHISLSLWYHIPPCGCSYNTTTPVGAANFGICHSFGLESRNFFNISITNSWIYCLWSTMHVHRCELTIASTSIVWQRYRLLEQTVSKIESTVCLAVKLIFVKIAFRMICSRSFDAMLRNSWHMQGHVLRIISKSFEFLMTILYYNLYDRIYFSANLKSKFVDKHNIVIISWVLSKHCNSLQPTKKNLRNKKIHFNSDRCFVVNIFT